MHIHWTRIGHERRVRVPEKRSFGQMTKLPSGRIRARYLGPDGRRHSAPYTFETKQDAEAWLVDERRILAAGTWAPPKERAKTAQTQLTLGLYADSWLRDRTLKPRTRAHYRKLLDNHVLPTFGHVEVKTITPESVRAWHALMGTSTPTQRAHAYSLLRTILGSAVQDRLIAANPAHIRGAGNSTRVHKIKPASLEELEVLVTAMPERYRVMALLAAWCALRFGELAELRRKDIDQTNGVIRVRRAVVRADGETIVGTPKSDAGVRDVSIPPHLMPAIKEHIQTHAQPGKEGLLFPAAGGGHLANSSFYRVYYPAREAAGRPDLRFHDLRHSGAVLAAQTGATLAELMGRLGHSTPGAALRYQHAAQERDREIAKRLSLLAHGGG
jgi:integrase